MRRSLTFWTILALIPACGESSTDEAQARARPVTVLVLEEVEPQPGGLVPGVVVPYRQTEIGFDVAGRVIRLATSGTTCKVGRKVPMARPFKKETSSRGSTPSATSAPWSKRSRGSSRGDSICGRRRSTWRRSSKRA